MSHKIEGRAVLTPGSKGRMTSNDSRVTTSDEFVPKGKPVGTVMMSNAIGEEMELSIHERYPGKGKRLPAWKVKRGTNNALQNFNTVKERLRLKLLARQQ